MGELSREDVLALARELLGAQRELRAVATALVNALLDAGEPPEPETVLLMGAARAVAEELSGAVAIYIAQVAAARVVPAQDSAHALPVIPLGAMHVASAGASCTATSSGTGGAHA